MYIKEIFGMNLSFVLRFLHLTGNHLRPRTCCYLKLCVYYCRINFTGYGLMTGFAAIIEMLLPQQQSLLTELIQSTVVRVCVEHVPFEGRLELDGLVCINSDVGGARQIVVKIHTVVGRKDILAERMIAPKAAWPAAPCVVTKNGLSHDTVPHDARSLPHEDASSAPSEALEDGDYRSVEAVDECLPPWSHHAPQILKLLTKSDAASDKTMKPSSTEVGPISSAGVGKTSDATIKREPTVNEDADAMEVEASGDHHGAKWRCKMCQLLCANFGELESHMRNVHVRFVCRLCLNSFTLSCNLRRHMKLHAGVRPHSCPFCSASFSRSTDLKIHMKKHPAANASSDHDSPKSVQEPLSLKKPAILHECDFCGKGFATAAHLAEHRHTHNINTDCQQVTGNDRNDSDGERVTSQADSSCHTAITNGSVSDKQDSVCNIVSGSIDFAETVREFAPLFHLGDAGIDAVESDKASEFLATITQHTNSTKPTAPVRSKRKGLPMKRIDVGTDDYEMAADDGESMMKGESMVEYESLPAVSPNTDMNPPASSQNTEEQADVVSGDLESKMFNCQYAGGCSVTCHGFTAYEWHYTTAHGGRYPCSLCPQSFTSRNNRRRHTDGHAGAAGHGRHQCVTCGKRFARADIIKEHRLTHTRSYQAGTCSKCGESCGTKKSSLLLHLKRCLTIGDIDGDIDDAKIAKPELAN